MQSFYRFFGVLAVVIASLLAIFRYNSSNNDNVQFASFSGSFDKEYADYSVFQSPVQTASEELQIAGDSTGNQIVTSKKLQVAKTEEIAETPSPFGIAEGEALFKRVISQKPVYNPDIQYIEKEVQPTEGFALNLGAATLQGDSGSVKAVTNLSITALQASDLPRLNPGMVNVTAGCAGYRFLPHGSTFDKPLRLSIGYDSTKIPKGHYAQEIRTYYYDEGRKIWVALFRDTVNKEGNEVGSRATDFAGKSEGALVYSWTTHFTDMINAIVKAPEMPETQEFTPTSLKELEAANPASGIQLMQPPTANSQGTASLSYPINVPAGRQGLQPNLAVSYSSEAGNGLLGMGWDMQIPAITVDNKWGAPRYESGSETETYLYNGEELLPSARLGTNWVSPRYASGKQFFPRVEGGFEQIIRYGNSPDEYFWIVTDKQGTKYYYGTYNGSSAETSRLLKTEQSPYNIAHWPLCKVIDLNGNYMQYNYQIKQQTDNEGRKLGQQLWLENIEYTGYEGNNGANEDGVYKVVFCHDDCDLENANLRGVSYTQVQTPQKTQKTDTTGNSSTNHGLQDTTNYFGTSSIIDSASISKFFAQRTQKMEELIGRYDSLFSAKRSSDSSGGVRSPGNMPTYIHFMPFDADNQNLILVRVSIYQYDNCYDTSLLMSCIATADDAICYFLTNSIAPYQRYHVRIDCLDTNYQDIPVTFDFMFTENCNNFLTIQVTNIHGVQRSYEYPNNIFAYTDWWNNTFVYVPFIKKIDTGIYPNFPIDFIPYQHNTGNPIPCEFSIYRRLGNNLVHLLTTPQIPLFGQHFGCSETYHIKVTPHGNLVPAVEFDMELRSSQLSAIPEYIHITNVNGVRQLCFGENPPLDNDIVVNYCGGGCKEVYIPILDSHSPYGHPVPISFYGYDYNFQPQLSFGQPVQVELYQYFGSTKKYMITLASGGQYNAMAGQKYHAVCTYPHLLVPITFDFEIRHHNPHPTGFYASIANISGIPYPFQPSMFLSQGGQPDVDILIPHIHCPNMPTTVTVHTQLSNGQNVSNVPFEITQNGIIINSCITNTNGTATFKVPSNNWLFLEQTSLIPNCQKDTLELVQTDFFVDGINYAVSFQNSSNNNHQITSNQNKTIIITYSCHCFDTVTIHTLHNGQALSNVSFEIIDNGKVIDACTTDINGIARVVVCPDKWYFLKQTNLIPNCQVNISELAETEFLLNRNSYRLLLQNSTTNGHQITNNYLKTITISYMPAPQQYSVKVVSSVNHSKTLPGAVFELYDINDLQTPIEIDTTNNLGMITGLELEAGKTYRLIQTIAGKNHYFDTNDRPVLDISVAIDGSVTIHYTSSYILDTSNNLITIENIPLCISDDSVFICIGVVDADNKNTKLPFCLIDLYEYDANSDTVFLQSSHTNSSGEFCVKVKTDKRYCVLSSSFGGGYQHTAIRFDFIILSVTGKVVISNDTGIVQTKDSIMPYYYPGDCQVQKLLIPAHKYPVPPCYCCADSKYPTMPGCYQKYMTTVSIQTNICNSAWSGVGLRITLDTNVITGITDASGLFTFNAYSPHQYSLELTANVSGINVSANNRFTLADPPVIYPIYIMDPPNNGCTFKLSSWSNHAIVVNYTPPPINYSVRVLSSIDSLPLPNAIFKWQEAGSSKPLRTDTSDSQGKLPNFTINLCNGNPYLLVQTKAPSGYTMGGACQAAFQISKGILQGITHTHQITVDTGLKLITVYNRPADGDTISFRIKKIDSEDGSTLSGAEFKVYQYPDMTKAIANCQSGTGGLTSIIGLQKGKTYRIVESNSPTDYSNDPKTYFEITVALDGNAELTEQSGMTDGLNLVGTTWVCTVKNAKLQTVPANPNPICNDCQKMYNPDYTINARNGFRQSSKDKLRKIIIYYGDSCVRSYSFCYGEDVFGRAQLQEIEQWGTDYCDSAYVHKLTYYNEIGNGQQKQYLRGKEDWSDEKDDNVNLEKDDPWWKNRITGLLNILFPKPTALGGSQTLFIGGGGGIDLGLGFNAASKLFSVGYYGSGSGSWSHGRTMLLDMDGDGLPDKVYTKGKNIYYCSQIPNTKTFENDTLLEDISRFLRTKTTTSTHGPQASFGYYGGVEWNKSTSTTNIYMTDANGDGFPDIIVDSKISLLSREIQAPKLNFIDDCNPPEISQSVGDLKVDCGGELEGVEDIPIEEEDDEHPMDENMLKYDVVRVWKAGIGMDDFSGPPHCLFAPVWLEEDSTTTANFCGEEDGVIVSIELHGGHRNGIGAQMAYDRHIVLWGDTIYADDRTIHCENSSWKWYSHNYSLPVAEKGLSLSERYRCAIEDIEWEAFLFYELKIAKDALLFFRVRPIKNGVKSKVVWDPQVFNRMMMPVFPYDSLLRDANGLLFPNGEQASRSQLRQGDSVFYCPFAGNLHVSYNFSVSGLSDNVYYNFYHNDTLIQRDLGHVFIDWNTDVNVGDSLRFIVECATNVDLVNAQWRPHVWYESILDSTDVISTIDSTGEHLLEFYPAPYYQFYADIVQPTSPYVHQWAGTPPTPPTPTPMNIQIYFPISSFLRHGEEVRFVIKSDKRKIIDEVYTRASTFPFYYHTLQPANGEIFYLECYLSHRDLLRLPDTLYIVNINNQDYPCTVYAPSEKHPVFGEMYGGWGQFLHRNDDNNPSWDVCRHRIIDYNKIRNLVDKVNSVTPQSYPSPFLDTTHLPNTMGGFEAFVEAGGFNSRMNQLRNNTEVIPMFADNEHYGYAGFLENTWIRGAEISLGGIPCYDDDEDEDESPCDKEYAEEEEDNQDRGGGNTRGNTSGSRGKKPTPAGGGIDKISITKSTAYSFGPTEFVSKLVPYSIGESKSNGTTTLYNDLMDLNGDGYPDVIKSGNVQYSKPYNGSLEPPTNVPFGGLPHHISKNTSITTSITGRFIKTMQPPTNSSKGNNITYDDAKEEPGDAPDKDDENATFDTSIFNLPSLTMCYDTVEYTLMDVNGDGLPDRVYKGGSVHLNLGYRFESTGTVWVGLEKTLRSKSTSISHSKSKNLGEGWKGKLSKGGADYGAWAASISGGIGISGSASQTEAILMDMNGDGLPDLVWRTGTQLKVRLNIGSSFGDSITWTGTNIPDYQWNNSITANINGAGTLGFTIPIFPPLALKISGTANINAGFSITADHVQFMDIDGDGYADVLMSNARDDLQVMKSNIGKTGLLKSVTNPLGGSYEMVYTQTEPTVFHSRRWTMNMVKINDGLPGDGIDQMMTTYQYENGYYDRKERAFYGFAKITEREYNSGIYRTTTSYYHNDDYYTQGLLAAELLQAGNMGAKYIYTRNAYGTTTIAGHTEAKFISLDTTITCYYEGQTEAKIRQMQTYLYDNYGNVTQTTEASTHTPQIVKNIDYHPQIAGNYCVGIPKIEEIPGYRKRETEIDGKGQITKIIDYLEDAPPLETTMSYDPYGNCTHIQYPDNSYTYIYEVTTHTYPMSVTNDFGHTSYVNEYDLRFGVPLLVTDKSGKKMEYKLDNWGRITKIRSPKEIEANEDYTIKYEYYRGNLRASPKKPFSSRTYHYDPANPGNDIKVFTYIDGLGRIVQTKKSVEMGVQTPQGSRPQSMIVSGKVFYDALGRAVKSKYPTVEAGCNTVFSTAEDSENPSTATYDIMDRPLIQIAPDWATVQYGYDFGKDINGNMRFRTIVMDPNGHVSEALSNVLGLQYKVKPAGHQPVHFEYDLIGQCTKVYGDDFERTYEYDQLGRKTVYTEDQLTEIYTYTKTNLTKKSISWVEGLQGRIKFIDYDYDFNRPKTVQSSEYQQPIEYKYNNKGKLSTIIDASGTQTFEYGSMGEVTKQTRIYTLPFMQQSVSIETNFEYDCWGRTLNITYPDGEKVYYNYDYGGQLKSIEGEKAGEQYSYLKDLKYDKFGAEIRIVYGNEIATDYTYNPQNLRLKTQKVSLSTTNQNYLTTTYDEYDSKGNIKKMNITNHLLPQFSVNQTFDYDAADQLTNARGNNGSLYKVELSYGNYGRMANNKTMFTDPQTNSVQIQNNTYAYPTVGNAPSNSFAPVSANNGTIEFEFGINGSLRKRSTPQKTEYYLFNAFNQMKAYSNNGETYGYYGYDAGGQRTYKVTLNSIEVQTNVLGGKTLQAEKFTLYPSGYININQDGNYTKHYYAGSARIASKIGGGYEQSLTYGIIQNTAAFDIMLSELSELIPDDEVVDVLYPFEPITHLIGDDPEAYENALFFYHGSNTNSTQLVTDISGNITQIILYTPFGDVISNYNPMYWQDGIVPEYMFSGKILDEESGMNYFHARYYDPTTTTFISPDPFFELRPWMSRYAYCSNNPINRIDPTGLFDSRPEAEKCRQKALRRYKKDKDRVGDIYDAGTPEKPDYRFDIYGKGKNKHTRTYFRNGRTVVTADRADVSISSRKDWINYTKALLFGINSGIGFASLGATIKGGYLRSNELWHISKNGNKHFIGGRYWKNNICVNGSRALIAERGGVFRSAGTKLGYAGIAITVGDAVLSGEYKASQGINVALTTFAIAVPGVGSIVAGLYFVTDFGFTVFTGRGIGDRIDDAVGTLKLYNGLY